MAGKGKLDNKSIQPGILIEFPDLPKELFRFHIILKPDKGGSETHLLTILDLVGYISFAASVMAHQDGSQVRRPLSVTNDRIYFCPDFIFNGLCSGFSVN